MEIPLNICTYYHDSVNIPENMKNNFDKLVSENPEFKVELFDVLSGREFIKENFDEKVLEAYDSGCRYKEFRNILKKQKRKEEKQKKSPMPSITDNKITGSKLKDDKYIISFE